VDPDKTAVAGAASIAAGVRPSADGPAPVPQKETRPRLADILADPSKRGDTASVFASLFSAWGIASSADKSDLSCNAAGVHGLECLFQTGNWLKLRRYDLPAILELVLPSGQRCRAAVIRLDNETATLVIGGRSYTFPLLEIDRVWDGSFILVWKPPFALRNLSQGMRGNEVLWVRQALDRLEGKESNPSVSDLFDSDLQRRVKAFQRAQVLIPDGYVGSETLVRLTLALEGEKAPSISRQSR
jgi:general secretion pathway protein A